MNSLSVVLQKLFQSWIKVYFINCVFAKKIKTNHSLPLFQSQKGVYMFAAWMTSYRTKNSKSLSCHYCVRPVPPDVASRPIRHLRPSVFEGRPAK